VTQVTDFSGGGAYPEPVFVPVQREVVMQKNVGGIDRGLRIALGVGLLAWAALGQDSAHLWGLVGLVPLATGLMGWCPAYLPFGIKTCRTQ
jgi:hypothetical protein